MHVNFDQSCIRLVDGSDAIGTVPWSREFPLLARLILGDMDQGPVTKELSWSSYHTHLYRFWASIRILTACSWAYEREGHEEAAVQPLWESGDPL